MSHRLSALFPAWDVLEQLHESAASNASHPAVYWDDDAAYVSAELPGVSVDDVEVTVDEDKLHISATRNPETDQQAIRQVRQERPFGKFQKSYRLPFAVEKGNVEAELAAGVLNLTLPRAEETKPTRIPVSAK